MSSTNHRFIVSGGGTGGHIFPALSIAEGLKQRFPDSEILFVGAIGKMEMEKVPAAGFPIVGLPVAGFHRGEVWRNLMFVPKLISSLWKARSVVSRLNNEPSRSLEMIIRTGMGLPPSEGAQRQTNSAISLITSFPP